MCASIRVVLPTRSFYSNLLCHSIHSYFTDSASQSIPPLTFSLILASQSLLIDDQKLKILPISNLSKVLPQCIEEAFTSYGALGGPVIPTSTVADPPSSDPDLTTLPSTNPSPLHNLFPIPLLLAQGRTNQCTRNTSHPTLSRSESRSSRSRTGPANAPWTSLKTLLFTKQL
ncbi:hypothetical protein GYMLUDRAFT_762685 [Collybiopsis luxurians FD-317 M1]|uniref:Uncharacterized protein n=1 Tax=Collybiopsis luxurians FD-317 M1 TaxID=944289 RepID=A0A0D0CPD5_9AGAR|nr:hypothetical protein GYMLUDRAFT_762685 [Collybiopsis luxurians FD-317 M1]